MTVKLLAWAPATQITRAAIDLRAAADHLEINGWTQHVYSNNLGHHCAAGAMNKLCTDDARSFNSRSSIAFGVFYRITGQDIATFNDEPGRTAKQVIDKLREVADLADAILDRELCRERA